MTPQLETLYRKHAPAILRFAWGLSGDRATAEDLVAETFYRLLVKAPRIETRTALAYLLAITRNTWLTSRRRANREVPLTDDFTFATADPDATLDDRTRLDAVRNELQNLPEGERAALLLRVDHDLSYEDIAAALDTTVGAAKVRVHRARVRLASALQAQGKTT